MAKKTLIIIGAIAFVILLAATFFAGRAGRNEFKTNLNSLKGVIDEGNRTTGLVIEAYKREAGYVNTLESNNGKIIERLDKLQISLDERNRYINNGLAKQLEYIKSLADIDRRTGTAIDGLGGSLEESLGLINRAIEKLPE